MTKNKKNKHNKIVDLAKSKLNSIETLLSQALIDLENSHDKNKKSSENGRSEQNLLFFFSMYKMFKTSADTFGKNCVYNIIERVKKLWLKNKDIGKN